jgi:hypothetical protein
VERFIDMTKLTAPFRNVANASENLDFFPNSIRKCQVTYGEFVEMHSIESAICGVRAVRTRRPKDCD